MDGRRCLGIVTTRPRIGERRRWRKHFSPDCSLAGASPVAVAVEASAPLSDVRPSVPLLPRRGGVSFRAGEPTVLFREKVDGVKLCLVVGRDDHDGSADAIRQLHLRGKFAGAQIQFPGET